MISTRQEPVYHAAHGGLAASLSETSARLRGRKWACQVESQKNAGFLACLDRMHRHQKHLSRFACMLPLRLLKGSRLIAVVMHPHGEDDPDPHIGKGTDSHRMAFAFSSFAVVVLLGPWFTLRRLPGELMQAIAQGLDAAQSPMRFSVHAALKEHGRGPCQSLQTAGIPVAASIIADFC